MSEELIEKTQLNLPDDRNDLGDELITIAARAASKNPNCQATQFAINEALAEIMRDELEIR